MPIRRRRPRALWLLALVGLSSTACPGSLEDPERFPEPDASTGGKASALVLGEGGAAGAVPDGGSQ
ncbi:MAG: hypothetical protein U0263_18490 [Polyangiaceae bacterium]